MASKTESNEAAPQHCTSLRVLLGVESEDQVHEVADKLADALIACGYNTDDSPVTAVIACVPDGEDVHAFARGPESFLKWMNGEEVAFVLIPDPDPQDEEAQSNA